MTKTLASWKKNYDKPRQCVKKKRHHFAYQGPSSQSYSFSSSHVWMWELAHKEGWALKNWCFQTVVLEKTLESLLDSKEIKPVNPKRNKRWILIGGMDGQYFGHLMWRNGPLEKTLMLGKIKGGKRRGRQRMRCLDGITDSMDMSLSKLQSWWWPGKPGILQSMKLQRVGYDWATELNWSNCGTLWTLAHQAHLSMEFSRQK